MKFITVFNLNNRIENLREFLRFNFILISLAVRLMKIVNPNYWHIPSSINYSFSARKYFSNQ